jgi:hypothetical protein
MVQTKLLMHTRWAQKRYTNAYTDTHAWPTNHEFFYSPESINRDRGSIFFSVFSATYMTICVFMLKEVVHRYWYVHTWLFFLKSYYLHAVTNHACIHTVPISMENQAGISVTCILYDNFLFQSTIKLVQNIVSSSHPGLVTLVTTKLLTRLKRPLNSELLNKFKRTMNPLVS